MAHSKREKMSLEQVLRLVEQLPADEQEQLRLKLNGQVKNQSPAVAEHPFLDWHITLTRWLHSKVPQRARPSKV
jgi:hypothetical protein